MTRLVFLSNVPQNFSRNNYVSCISVNERENGTNTGRMIGEYLKEKPHAKVGFIIHGAMFYGTTERDNCAEKILRESYPDIEITARKGFIQIENAYKVCYEMINEHPDIQALYVSWDRPALLAIKALKALNRTDIAVFTTDLDFEIAEEMNQGFVKGLSTQRPYDQGKAAALAVAKSLVSDNVPKYIGVQPYVVHEKQLKRAWKDIFFEALPDSRILLPQIFRMPLDPQKEGIVRLFNCLDQISGRMTACHQSRSKFTACLVMHTIDI